ncbi:hypothetical protein SAMN04488077_1312 [Roseovarius tolerans]|uniref:Uncharacterized protein n=1 Tax=Roseovarius tolerans TaxID=74031 RepID=A0A1H8JFU0_9RHOB|nr:hypothetical protein [Roseovarius tolerans]SEN79562.1 hypothetical protein SAMN04488077_1312 [Roseovarius tolerans]
MPNRITKHLPEETQEPVRKGIQDHETTAEFEISAEIDYNLFEGYPLINLEPDEEYLSEKLEKEIVHLFEELGSPGAKARVIKKLQEDFNCSGEQRSMTTPPRWRGRTTGREVSPADWIHMHYGQTLEDGTWIPDGLNRSDLKDLDFPLYQAFAKWLERHPEDAFDGPVQKKPRYETNEEALKARKLSEREASARYREKLSSNI